MGTNLGATIFSNAHLSNTNLKGVNLKKALFISCEQIESAEIDQNTQFPDYIYQLESSSSNFNCINFLKGKGLDLQGRNLPNMNLYMADLRQANLSNANLMETSLINANLRQANLSNANLMGTNLMGTILEATNFKNADLRNTNLKGVDLKLTLNISCEQLKSAVIDQKTQFPDNIIIVNPQEPNQDCIEKLKKKKPSK